MTQDMQIANDNMCRRLIELHKRFYSDPKNREEYFKWREEQERQGK